MKSREDLVYRTLDVLGVLAVGQAPSAEDYAAIDSILVPALSELSKRGIYLFGDPDKIEDEAFISLAIALASHAPGGFGNVPSDERRLLAESNLREIYAETLSGQAQQAEYF